MDETSSEAGNLVNEDKSSENSSVLGTLSWQDKVESSDPGDKVVVFQVDFPRKPLFQETVPIYLDFASPPPLRYTPCLRRIVRHKEIAFDRECKKLEVVWTNRGLPVDKESLCSAASKDAFDLSDLSESLPSTPFNNRLRKVPLYGQPSFDSRRNFYSWKMRQHTERFETMRSSFRERRIAFDRVPPSRMPASETVSSTCSSLKESVNYDAMLKRSLARLSRRNRLCREVPPPELETEPTRDEQKETSEERENKEKALQCWTGLASKFANVSSSVDKLEEKLKEKQNSDAENNREFSWILHPSSSLEAPLPKLQQDVGQCSGWDYKRKWISDFQFRDVRAPLNSPVKKEGNADAKDQLLSMEKVVAEIRQSTMRLLREQSKSRTLNSFRGELSGDMDESESEKPPSEESPRASTQNHLISVKEAALCLRHVKKCRRRIMHLNESVKCFRSFQSPYSHGIIKSDKVVPD